jgi:hypothetical protein
MSFNPARWGRYVDAKKKAGQAAYQEFQQTKTDTVLALLEGIQQDLEQAAAMRSGWRRVIEVMSNLPGALREAIVPMLKKLPKAVRQAFQPYQLQPA